MREKPARPGSFVFSLDMELAWGDLWNTPPAYTSSRDGTKEREAIRRILDLMDEFGVAATWAITGHLFYDHCEECTVCPIIELKGKDPRFDTIWQSNDSMWYGADIVEAILARKAGHEIAFHGYTHRYFDKLTTEEAKFEIQEWLRLANRRGLPHYSVIFPQGRIAHLDLFREVGFITYRGKDVRHPLLSIPFFGKVVNRFNLKLSFLTPQIYEITNDASGLVNIPSSQWMFRTRRAVETLLDSVHLETLRFRETARAIQAAAATGKVIHLWAHPHEFRTEKDFEKLRYLFGKFAEQAHQGSLRSITMADLAKEFLGGNTGVLQAESAADRV
jgi:hypothetical protein